MPTGPLRDLDSLRDGLRRWLSSLEGRDIEIESLSHASEGLSNETIIVRATIGGSPSVSVVRLAPQVSSFPEYDLSMQADVHGIVARHGISAPVPAIYEADESWLGAPFLSMPFVAGTIPGPVPAVDQWVLERTPDQQRALEDALISVLARLHRIDIANEPIVARLRGGVGGGLSAELSFWADYLAWAADGAVHPILARALQWCVDHEPNTEGRSSLLWGDPRLGNLIFDTGGGLLAVLDWELASVGPPEMDLGWYLGLDGMMTELFDQRVPGFSSRDEFVARYEAASGQSVCDLDYHEVFALTRAMAINDRQLRAGARSDKGRERARAMGEPLLAILERRIDRSLVEE
jgi:aminoglycoside phosphotransferase (APT) family kinase protein